MKNDPRQISKAKKQTPHWSLLTNFWVAAGIISFTAIIVVTVLQKPVWVELEILALVVGVMMTLFYSYVLYHGVRFSEEDTISLVRIDPTFLDITDVLPTKNFSFFTEIGTSEGIAGMVLGIVLDIIVSVFLAAVLTGLLWCGVELMIASIIIVAIPLFYIFKRSIFFVMKHVEECHGNFWRSFGFGFGYAAMKTAILCLMVFLAHEISNGIKVSNAVAQSLERARIPVKIGVIIPLTGGLAVRGDDIAKMLTVLKDHFEAEDLTHSYEFIVEDGKCGTGNTSVSAAIKLITLDKVKYLITGCSGETLQAGPIAEKNKVLNIAVLSLHQDIKNLGDYIFRTYIDIEGSVTGFAKFMDSQSEGKIAILTEENSFTFGVRDLLLKELGSKVIYADDLPPDSEDFKTLFVKMNARGVKGIYFNAMSERTLINLVNQARKQKFTQRFFSYNFPETSSFRPATGKNSDNLYFIGTPDVKHSSPEFKVVLDKYLKKYPAGPSYEFLLRTTFDAIKSIVDGVEAVGDDPIKVKDFLYHYSKLGALGKVEYDSNGDIRNLNYVLKRIREDGQSEIVGELVKP